MRSSGWALVFAALSAPSWGQIPSDIADLVGARGTGGETQLESRGYRLVTTNTVRDTQWSFWWNDRRRQCISVATTDGRYAEISSVPVANCDVSAMDAGTRPASREAGNGEVSISLVCIGSGSGPAAQSTSGYRYNSKTRRYEPEFGTALGRDGFSSDLEIEISGGVGRVRPTGKLVSPMHSGGVDGWWPIDDLMVTPDRITGGYRMNALNKPRIEYDRRTRVVHIRETTEFTGRCETQ